MSEETKETIPAGQYNVMMARNDCEACKGTGRVNRGFMEVIHGSGGKPVCDCVRSYTDGFTFTQPKDEPIKPGFTMKKGD